MVIYGSFVIAVGVVVIVIHHKSSTLNVYMGGVATFGILLILGGTLAGRRLLKELPTQMNLPARTMELFTYPYSAGPRNVFNVKRILATLDEVGSHERTPAIEFKAIWFTPGIGEAEQSGSGIWRTRERPNRSRHWPEWRSTWSCPSHPHRLIVAPMTHF